MDLNYEPPPSALTIRPQPPSSGRHSLPPAGVPGPQHDLPSYPSSTLQYYFPSPSHVANYAHTVPFRSISHRCDA